MSLFRYDLMCDHCHIEYSIINRIEQDPTFCSYCGELLSTEEIDIDNMDTLDQDDLGV